jgi:hypothetical protein
MLRVVALGRVAAGVTSASAALGRHEAGQAHPAVSAWQCGGLRGMVKMGSCCHKLPWTLQGVR